MSLDSGTREALTRRLVASGWVASGVSSANATSLADKDGEPGKRHYITSVGGAFVDHATVAQSLSITLGTGTGGQGGPTTVWRTALKTKFHATFWPPIEVPEGERVRIQLNAGGDSITGYTYCTGFSA